MKDVRRVRRSSITLFIFAGMVALGAAPNAHAQPQCTSATCEVRTDFTLSRRLFPLERPVRLLECFIDGRGNWSASLTFNDNGVILRRPSEGGTYTVNPDCTGSLFPTSGGTVQVVVVEDGREIYQMRTEPNTILLYSVTKKIFPGSDQ